MNYRQNPHNGDKISVLGFGCMRFCGDGKMMGKFNGERAEQMIKLAYDKGINFFDTAYIYTGSEVAIGNALKRYGIRRDIMLCTKFPLLLARRADDLDKYFNKQLERLQTDYIDYYLFHMLSDMGTWQKLLEWDVINWIKDKKESGAIKNIGFSFHGSQEAFLKLLEVYDWEAVLLQYNYSDENYQAGIKGIRKAYQKNIPVFIMEPLLGGRLSTSLPQKAIDIFKRANPDITPSAWGLKWLWNHPEITCVLSGMSQPFQIEENCQTAESIPSPPPSSEASDELLRERSKEQPCNVLTESELATFDEVKKIFRESFKIPCTGCRYCLPCPFGVDIPSCFTAFNTAHAIDKGKAKFSYAQGTLMGEPSYAGLCRKCGKCEKHCPQQIPIVKSLVEVKKYMEGFKFKAMSIIFKLFLRKKGKSDGE